MNQASLTSDAPLVDSHVGEPAAGEEQFFVPLPHVLGRIGIAFFDQRATSTDITRSPPIASIMVSIVPLSAACYGRPPGGLRGSWVARFLSHEMRGYGTAKLSGPVARFPFHGMGGYGTAELVPVGDLGSTPWRSFAPRPSEDLDGVLPSPWREAPSWSLPPPSPSELRATLARLLRPPAPRARTGCPRSRGRPTSARPGG
jgi:hypothetical protein